MGDNTAPLAYTAARQRLISHMRHVDDAALVREVAACPGWQVRDVIAHLAGVAADQLDGRTPTGDDWTARQVKARRDLPFAAVLDEWETRGPAFEALMSSPEFKTPGGIFVSDVVNHEVDVRSTMGERTFDVPEAPVALATMMWVQTNRIGQAGLPALRVVADGTEFVNGDGEPGATVAGPVLELLRAATGRRTADQIRALKWDGDSEPYLAVFAPFEFPIAPLPA